MSWLLVGNSTKNTPQDEKKDIQSSLYWANGSRRGRGPTPSDCHHTRCHRRGGDHLRSCALMQREASHHSRSDANASLCLSNVRKRSSKNTLPNHAVRKYRDVSIVKVKINGIPYISGQSGRYVRVTYSSTMQNVSRAAAALAARLKPSFTHSNNLPVS